MRKQKLVKKKSAKNAVKKSFNSAASQYSGIIANGAKSSKSLGAARSSVKNYLKNVGNVPRGQLVDDLKSAGFEKVFDGKGMQHFQRGNWKIRLDPPQSGTPFNHMHINRGGNRNAFDIFLNSTHYKSPGAHISIR